MPVSYTHLDVYKRQREGGAWGQEITGTLAAVKNLRVKVDVGSVVVHGGQQPGINYVIHTRSYTSSEQDARRQFESFKISAYIRGDTAWIVGDWQGRDVYKRQVHDHRAHVDFDSQILGRGQRACDFLTPRTSLTGDVRFLRQRERRKHGQNAKADELWRTLQNEPPQFHKSRSINLGQLRQHGASL